MGYCYAVSGGRRRLVCDSCGEADGTVRKRRCPMNYCPASAMCSGCFASGTDTRAAFDAHHVEADCAGCSARYAAKMAAEAAALAAGGYVFCSAIGRGDAVEMTFRSAGGATRSLVAEKSVYEAACAAEVATYDDVEKYAARVAVYEGVS